MNTFQATTRRRLAAFAEDFQLHPYDLIDSGNGTEYKNFDNDTIFTVYHKRLDIENVTGLEVALGVDNAVRELSLPSLVGVDWLSKLVRACPEAESKGPLFWPRVGIRSEEDISRLEDAIRDLYSRMARAAAASQVQVGEPGTIRTPQAVDERLLSFILTRRGQPQFRESLLKAYRGACAVTGCTDEPVLEAAHITPHAVEDNYHTSNGLLLRADIHTLFDLQLISVEPIFGKVVVARRISVEYTRFHETPLRLPMEVCDYPDHLALMRHYQSWLVRGDASYR